MALGRPLPPWPPLSPRLIGKPDDTRVTMPETCQPPEVVFTKLLRAVPEERDVIDEVDCRIVRAVISARSNVVFPSQIGVGHVAEISAAVAAGGGIDGA